MGQIAHPDDDGSIEVEIIDSASHKGDYVQVQAVEDGVELSDQSGDAPWLESAELRDGSTADEQSESEADEVQDA